MLDEILKTSEAFEHIMKYAKRPDLDERMKFMRTVSIFIFFLGGVVYLIHMIVGMLLGTVRVFSMPFFVVSVPRRREAEIAWRLFGLRRGKGVYAIYVPPEATRALYVRNAKTPGIIIIEAEDEGKIAMMMSKLKVRRRIIGEISREELESLLKPKILIKPGATVYIISGPFKGNKGVIEKIDEDKMIATVRLENVVIAGTPLTVDIPFDHLQVASEERSRLWFSHPVSRP